MGDDFDDYSRFGTSRMITTGMVMATASAYSSYAYLPAAIAGDLSDAPEFKDKITGTIEKTKGKIVERLKLSRFKVKMKRKSVFKEMDNIFGNNGSVGK